MAVAAGLGLAAAVPQAAAQVRFHGEAAGGAATVRVMSWRDIPFRTVVRQQFDYSCGSAALATFLTYHLGRPTSEAQTFRTMFAAGDQQKIQKVGFSMLDMKHYLDAVGVRVEGYRLTLDDLAKSQSPAIALVNVGPYRHFVVIKGIRDGRVLVGDPALGLRTYPRADFAKIWNGVVLALADSARGDAAVFNLENEWAPWSVAPVREAGRVTPVVALTDNLMPLYQITPASLIDLPRTPQ